MECISFAFTFFSVIAQSHYNFDTKTGEKRTISCNTQELFSSLFNYASETLAHRVEWEPYFAFLLSAFCSDCLSWDACHFPCVLTNIIKSKTHIQLWTHTHRHTCSSWLVRAFRPNTQMHFIRASQRRVRNMFQVVMKCDVFHDGKDGTVWP